MAEDTVPGGLTAAQGLPVEVNREQGPWTISLRKSWNIIIASHPNYVYRSILEGLLQPGAGNPNGAQVRGAEHTTLGDSAEHTTPESDSADNTITEDECSTDHTRSNLQRSHKKRADPSSSSLSSSPPRGRKRSRREHSPIGGEPPGSVPGALPQRKNEEGTSLPQWSSALIQPLRGRIKKNLKH